MCQPNHLNTRCQLGKYPWLGTLSWVSIISTIMYLNLYKARINIHCNSIHSWILSHKLISQVLTIITCEVPFLASGTLLMQSFIPVDFFSWVHVGNYGVFFVCVNKMHYLTSTKNLFTMNTFFLKINLRMVF